MDNFPEPAMAPQEPETTTKVWGAWATLGLGLAVGLLFIVAQTLVIIGFLVFKIASGTLSDPMQYVQSLSGNGLVVALATIVSGVAGVALIALFIRIHGNRNIFDYLGLRRISWRTAITAVIVFVLAFVAIAGLEALYNALAGSSAESANSSFVTDTYLTAGWLPLLWLAVVGFAPVFEECFFRGFLFVGLVRSRIGAVGAILLTSLVWASLHIQYNIVGMATIVLLGIVLGVVRLKTRSLWSTIIIHSLWNLAALVGTALSLHAGW